MTSAPPLDGDDSVIIVIVSEGVGARKSFLRFMAMDMEGEAPLKRRRQLSLHVVRPIHSSKTNRNGKNGGERIGGGGGVSAAAA